MPMHGRVHQATRNFQTNRIVLRQDGRLVWLGFTAGWKERVCFANLRFKKGGERKRWTPSGAFREGSLRRGLLSFAPLLAKRGEGAVRGGRGTSLKRGLNESGRGRGETGRTPPNRLGRAR